MADEFFDSWPVRFSLILLGYGSVLLPGYLLIRWVEKYEKVNSHHGGESGNRSLWRLFLRRFAVGRPEIIGSTLVTHEKPAQPKKTLSFVEHATQLFGFFVGIQITLVSMGFFQERIMTQKYDRIINQGEEIEQDHFTDAQFLVLANRVVALAVAVSYLWWDWKNQPPHAPPLYMYAFCSISNTLSSYCQYEALKFVSFPTQTFCKASKLIPTMIMGRILRKERFSRGECLTATLLVIGAALFFYSTISDSGKGSLTEQKAMFWAAVSGSILMIGYLAFDAFTPNWQKKLFEIKPKISRIQMMMGVNVFSAILCLVSLLEQNSLFPSINFLLTHNRITFDVFLLSFCGALSQFFIYAIVERFGPSVLALIMTIRQFSSILLSSAYFKHSLNAIGLLGLFIAFSALCFNIYYNYRKKTIKPSKTSK
ncbi:unnamed protein product [Bursaphelenchus xylophilus]|uniref:Adenosine 3'-phospho 5'-phosphosulfate transporter 1 n=1 Tax=Bursaphelenchus xylophilus TaxID=6326 RepID=A0A1I7RLR7_BURXY|nr:unnamed protein product [Bursaphelenchus xylophilus]CAG9082651.1 unnamed protein product [Bursaphelenchus xylophilus]